MPDEKPSISPLPISFKDVRKYPVAAMLFLCLIAISVLYAQSKKENSDRKEKDASEIKSLKQEVKQLRTEVSFLMEQGRRSDSALADVKATLREIKKYNNIQ